jgi:biotin carboxylase
VSVAARIKTLKTLWVVGAGVEAVPGIQRAKAMGLHVVASDGNPDAPGFAFADNRVISDTYDAEGTAAAAKRHGIDGAIAMCTDVPFTVAMIHHACGLPGLPLGIAAAGQNKFEMKRLLQEKTIPTADGWKVRGGDEIIQLIDYLETARGSGTMVVKPIDSRGARGVQLVRDRKMAEFAYAMARVHSTSGIVIAEEWLEGPQVSIEGAMLPDGTFHTVGFLDRNYSRLDEFLPYVIEDGADGPTRLCLRDEEYVTQLFEWTAKEIVGTHPCTVKGDMVLTPEGPKVIELALRLSGGYMSTTLIPLMTGVDFVGVAIKLAVGDPVRDDEAFHARNLGVAIRYDIPKGCTNHTERKDHHIGIGATREEAIADAERYLPCRV